MDELSQLSCGHSCVVARPRGMATNSSCRCLRDIQDNGQRRRVQMALMTYRRELDEARRAVGEGWFAGGVTLAEAIARKCASLEESVIDASKRRQIDASGGEGS